MAKIIKQLTIAQVNNAKAGEKIYYLFDGEGLKLVIKPNGVKTWVFNYKRPYTLKRTEKNHRHLSHCIVKRCTSKSARIPPTLSQ